MTKRVNALVEASNLADLGNTRMSTQMASYYTNEVNKQPDTIPMMSYGIQITRQAEAPPSDLVDTESKLNNRYDILGRSGYVYRQGADGQGASGFTAGPEGFAAIGTANMTLEKLLQSYF